MNSSSSAKLEACRYLCRYCIIVSFGSCFLARKFVLSAITNFFFGRNFLFMMSEICEMAKSSNSLGYAMTEMFLVAPHHAEVKKRSVISISPSATLWSFNFSVRAWGAKQRIHVSTVRLIQRC